MRYLMRIAVLLVVIVMMSVVAVPVAFAQDGGEGSPQDSPADTVTSVAENIQFNGSSQTLAECETAQCDEWRAEIATLLENNRPASYIYRYFAENYPDFFSDMMVVGQFGDIYPPIVNPDEVYVVAEEMYCDVCAGVSLSYCTSGQCQNWREEISDMLADGYTEREIRLEFAARYGEKISAVPIDDENRFLTFALPIGLALLAGAGVMFQVYRWRQKENTALQAARQAGTLLSNNRPVPDNVDPVLLDRVLIMLEENRS